MSSSQGRWEMSGRQTMDLIQAQIEVLARAEGFFQSAVLFALLKLQVFEKIGSVRRSLEELAREIAVPAENLDRLLRAGAALNYLRAVGSFHFEVPPALQTVLLESSGPSYIGNWIANLQYFEEALLRLDQAVSGSRPVLDLSRELADSGQELRNFTLSMHNYAVLRGRELADFLNLEGADSLLDLGCGPGTYAFELGRRHPHLSLYLLDSPGVLEVAKEVALQYDLTNPVRFLPLDALSAPIPGNYDLVLISNTLHMLGPEGSLELLRRVWKVLEPGGRVVVQAQFLPDSPSVRWPFLLDLVMLCTTSKGRNHSVSETLDWLHRAGFEDPSFCPMGLLNTNSFVIGRKPPADSPGQG